MILVGTFLFMLIAISSCYLGDGAAKNPEKLRKSIIACNNFNEDILDIKPFILGGENATLGEFPHMAALGYKNEATNNYKFECCGSLISNNYVLTAAHCLVRQDGKQPEIIRLGKIDLNGNADDVNPQDIPVLEMYVHENFSWQHKRNDIGIIRLSKSAKINENVRPICLYTNDSDPDELVATGYGDIKNREGPRFLLKTYLKSVALNECNVSLSTRAFGKPIFDTQFCAVSRGGPGDTCVGASGGPLQVEKKQENDGFTPASLVGVTSYGPLCGGSLPSVYTRVSKYLDWIERIVWP